MNSSSSSQPRIREAAGDISGRFVSTRAPFGGYLTVVFPVLFLSAFLLYIDTSWLLVLTLVAITFVLFLLGVTDRIIFDGRRIRRAGLVPVVWAKLNRSRTAIKIKDIECVRTTVFRSLRRGGRILYGYRTSIYGRGLVFTIGGRRRSYRRMVTAILPLLPEDILDRQSIDLKNYLGDPSEVLAIAKGAGIPAADVLENSFLIKRSSRRPTDVLSKGATDSVEEWRTIANQLKVSGRLLQSLEAFRRALLFSPKDGWLLLEAARCLQSFAPIRRDDKLDRRAAALLRLSERQARADADLLTELAESYCKFGDWRRAAKLFHRSIDLCGGTARTLRGLAEVALHEGKIAHVIHNFSAAGRVVESVSQRRWMNSEVEYFSRLNDDEEYLEIELARLDLLETIQGVRSSAVRIMLFGFVVIAGGLAFEVNTVANLGWAVSGLAIAVLCGTALIRKIVSQRLPPDALDEN